MSYENERREFKKAICRYADADDFLIGCGDKCEPTFNVSATNKKKKYAIKIFNEAKNIYDEAMRKRYSTTRAYRDSKFRDEVLSAYTYKCAICRYDIQEVLQAAHERDYEVSITEFDDSKHGICLCANHHLMYDSKLIDIDIANRSIKINDSRLNDTLWFKEFVNKYHSKIETRNDTED